MSGVFDQTAHPRGNPKNEGQFRQKHNSAPSGTLTRSSGKPAGDGIPAPTQQEIDNASLEAHYRQGDREISDAAAQTIARDLLHNLPSTSAQDAGAYTQLRQVADGKSFERDDHDGIGGLHRELAILYDRGAGSGGWNAGNERMDMMFTWALHGGDNSR